MSAPLRCILCGKTAREQGFRMLNTLDRTCQKCRPPIRSADAKRRYEERHPERVAAAKQRYAASARGLAAQARLRITEKYKSQRRSGYLRTHYALSVAEWNALWEAQGERCAFCETQEPGAHHGKFCTDHDHLTGAVRGILCDRCNRRVGFFGDDLAAFEEMVVRVRTYLTETAAQNQAFLRELRDGVAGQQDARAA